MAVTVTGFRGGINPQTHLAGHDALKQADEAKAKEVLASLSNDLANKSGVVRLLHTSHADKDMKFKNAGAFKRMFLSGDKLQRSGEVIHDLLKTAGLSPAKAKEFMAYVEKRGDKGVQAQKVLQYIDALRAEKGASASEALSKFGVDLDAQGRSLGEGAFGEVHVVRYRGEEFVYKQATADAEVDKVGDLVLADAAGKPLQPKVVKGPQAMPEDTKQSFEVYHGESPQDFKAPVVMADKKRLDDSLYEIPKHAHDDESSESESEAGDSKSLSLHFYQNLLQDKFAKNAQLASDGFQSSHASEDLRQPILDNPIGQEVPKLLIEEESIEPRSMEPQSPIEIAKAPAPEAAQAPAPAPLPASNSVPGQKLAREGVANAARVKDLPQVITPSVYVVRELASNGTQTYHAVAGQQRLKDWARTQAADSKFEVAGLLMPKAAGKNPIEYPKPARPDDVEPPAKLNVSRSDLKPMAQSAMSMLTGLASHGLIHGDIKPENLMWDAKTKSLQLIDNDGLQKVSKKAGSQVSEAAGAGTLTYLNPVKYARPPGKGQQEARLGLGRDLFAMGMVLLEASMHARGQGERADALMNRLTFSSSPAGQAILWMRNGNYRSGLETLKQENLPPNSVEAFARSCIVKSIEHEEARLAKQDFGFDRYDPGDDQHLLAQLEKELEQVR